MRIDAIIQDITKIEQFDAVVNSANYRLRDSSPGSINHAILKAAGPALYKAFTELGSCRTGEAVITEGFDMPCRYIIHTVVPKWESDREEEVTAAVSECYVKCLELARKNGIRTIAFPSLGTGNLCFPLARAAQTAVKAVTSFLEKDPESFDAVIWCLSNTRAASIYRAAITSLVPESLKSSNSRENRIDRSGNAGLLDFCNRYRLVLMLVTGDPELNDWCRSFSPDRFDSDHEILRTILLYRMTSDAHHAGFMTGRPEKVLKRCGLTPENFKALNFQDLCALQPEALRAGLEFIFREDEQEEGLLIRQSVADGCLLRVIDALCSILR